MSKALKWILGSVVVLVLLLRFVAYPILKSQTKKHSPEDTVELVQGDLKVSVFYNQPSKKGRDIFGGLVPYGEVWRTGANEATTFTTNQDLSLAGKTLPAGEYTLWTIPEQDQWTVIFNGKQYGWGVGFDGKASRDPEADVLQVQVPVEQLSEVVERFTITLEESPQTALTMAWDQTRIVVPVHSGG